MTPKEKLIKRIQKLGWGDILYGWDKNGNLININDYNEETDTFNAYGKDSKCFDIKFEDIPSRLYRA